MSSAAADGPERQPCCVVDAETQADLNHFARQLKAAAAKGKRFLFRSAASLITALARLPPQPVPAQRMAAYVRDGGPARWWSARTSRRARRNWNACCRSRA
jgi:uncharacterized protein YgbK (DUF1537 family)